MGENQLTEIMFILDKQISEMWQNAALCLTCAWFFNKGKVNICGQSLHWEIKGETKVTGSETVNV